jgi:hypothetical protein
MSVDSALGERAVVNADHARPFLAFWLLAIVAAAITSVGLRTGSTQVQVRGGSPSPVTRSASPDLLLGGLLRAQPTTAVTSPLSPVLWGSATAAEHAAGTVVVAAPGGSQSGTSAQGKGGHAVTTPTQAATPVKGHGGKVTEAVRGTGKSKHQKGDSAKDTTTPTATATASPTDGGHGKGKGGTSRRP